MWCVANISLMGCFAVLLDECLLVAYINNTRYQRMNSSNKVKIQSFSAHSPCRWKARGCFAVHKTILELFSITELQHSPKLLKKKGTKEEFIGSTHCGNSSLWKAQDPKLI